MTNFNSHSRSLRRRFVALGAATMMAASLGTGAASAAPLGSSQQDINRVVLGAHDNIHNGTRGLPEPIRGSINRAADDATNFLAPGALAARERANKPAPRPAPPKKRPAPAPRNNPCPANARGCVSLRDQTAWLQRGGKTSYGPVKVSTGKRGYETPKGWHVITRKVKNEVSRTYGNAPMPYSVYFTNNGHAFHQGSPYVMSHGCIHLAAPHAQNFFNALNVGDRIYIY